LAAVEFEPVDLSAKLAGPDWFNKWRETGDFIRLALALLGKTKPELTEAVASILDKDDGEELAKDLMEDVQTVQQRLQDFVEMLHAVEVRVMVATAAFCADGVKRLPVKQGPKPTLVHDGDAEILSLFREWMAARRHASALYDVRELPDKKVEKQAWAHVNQLHCVIFDTPAAGVMGLAIKAYLRRSMIGMRVGARIVPRFPVTASTGGASSRTRSASCLSSPRWS
jgi:hypothetical protein